MAASGTKKGNLRAVRDMMDGAEVVPPIASDAAPEPGPVNKRAGDFDQASSPRSGRRKPRRGDPELPMLPADCPVSPLGLRGQTYYFLDELGQLIALSADKVAQKGILSMFGRKAHILRDPEKGWPRYAKDGETINGWKVDVVSELLMGAAAIEGVFDPVGKVRGRGAWLSDDGALILHCGDKVLRGGSVAPVPGGTGSDDEPRAPCYFDAGVLRDDGGERIDHFVYPTGPALPRPSVTKASTETAQQLLAMIETWRWARNIDPVLLLGWIGAALIGGALRWRPIAWITGDSSAGKSTLQELLEHLMEGSLLQSTDATEAGLRQLLGYDTLPVALDEFESEEDNRRQLAIIKLARTASSGGKGVRGGQDHKGHEFTARSCFLFSSILLPPVMQQDRNRMAVLELRPLDRRAKPPVLIPRDLHVAGRAIRRRLVDQWPRFAATLEGYRRALGKVGHGGRSADQFGTLLACADLLLWDFEAPDDHVEEYAKALDARHLAEKSEDASDSERCARRISGSILPPMSGEVPADIGTWCIRALTDDTSVRAKERLAAMGMRVVQVRPADPGPDGSSKWSIGDPRIPLNVRMMGPDKELFLAVASDHVGLEPIFRSSHWAARPGAASVWAQTLRRLEVQGIKGPIAAIGNQKVRIGGQMRAATLVPLIAIAAIDHVELQLPDKPDKPGAGDADDDGEDDA